MLSQTWAIFYDAYRSLNARRLFWVVLILSGLVVGTFALVGIDERGISIAGWVLPVPITSQEFPPDVFYKGLFVTLGISMWLAWIGNVLALISTAGIFPDLLASGAIDLVVSKPLGRLRLFLTQYAAGLLFVTLQVSLFCGVSFLVIGLRGGVWEPGLFVAVPIVVCYFSYLFSICSLLGVVTRSTVASLLLTMLFWTAIWGLGETEKFLLVARSMQKHQVSWSDLQTGQAMLSPAPSADEMEPGDESRGLVVAQRVLFGLRTFLPKTQETLIVLENSLVGLADLPQVRSASKQEAMALDVDRQLRARSPAWSIGSSLAFEAAVVALAAFLFCRRDF